MKDAEMKRMRGGANGLDDDDDEEDMCGLCELLGRENDRRDEDEDEIINIVRLGVENGDIDSDHLRSILVTGNCGNLAVEKREDNGKGSDFLANEMSTEAFHRCLELTPKV